MAKLKPSFFSKFANGVKFEINGKKWGGGGGGGGGGRCCCYFLLSQVLFGGLLMECS